jgi:hypothetical protein
MSKSKLRVLHPMNSAGTTWLRESELVFVGKRPFAVVMPDVWIPLNRKMLKHDRRAPVYRYEGEVRDPASTQPRQPA